MASYQARAVYLYVLSEDPKHQQADSAYYCSKPDSAASCKLNPDMLLERDHLERLKMVQTSPPAVMHKDDMQRICQSHVVTIWLSLISLL